MNVLQSWSRTTRVSAALLSFTALAAAAPIGKTPPPNPLTAPEIGPGLLVCAIVLAVGSLLILTDWLHKRARAS